MDEFKCFRCKCSLTEDNWPSHGKRRRKYQCRKCINADAKEWRTKNLEHSRQYQATWQVNNQEKAMWLRAKGRANRNDIPFTIALEDIVIPEVCPVLGISLKRSDHLSSPNSPSLDRIEPTQGYVPGNVIVISNRANTLKSNASAEELELIAKWMRDVLPHQKS